MCKKCESKYPVLTKDLTRLFKIRDALTILKENQCDLFSLVDLELTKVNKEINDITDGN